MFPTDSKFLLNLLIRIHTAQCVWCNNIINAESESWWLNLKIRQMTNYLWKTNHWPKVRMHVIKTSSECYRIALPRRRQQARVILSCPQSSPQKSTRTRKCSEFFFSMAISILFLNIVLCSSSLIWVWNKFNGQKKIQNWNFVRLEWVVLRSKWVQGFFSGFGISDFPGRA